MKNILLILSLSILAFSCKSSQDSANKAVVKKDIGVGAEASKDATILFDGSRAMLDENWTYWDGPSLLQSYLLNGQLKKIQKVRVQ